MEFLLALYFRLVKRNISEICYTTALFAIFNFFVDLESH